jgi:hypothetical protein
VLLQVTTLGVQGSVLVERGGSDDSSTTEKGTLIGVLERLQAEAAAAGTPSAVSSGFMQVMIT